MNIWAIYNKYRTSYPREWDFPSNSELVEYMITYPCNCGNIHASEFTVERYEHDSKKSFVLVILCKQCGMDHDLSYEPEYEWEE